MSTLIHFPTIGGAKTNPAGLVSQPTSGRTLGRVFIAEDQDVELRAYSHTLRVAGWTVIGTPDGLRARDMLFAPKEPIDIALIDNKIPHLYGIDIVTALRKAGIRIPVVIMSSAVNYDLTTRAQGVGVAAVLNKPLALSGLSTCLQKIVAADRAAKAREQADQQRKA